MEVDNSLPPPAPRSALADRPAAAADDRPAAADDDRPAAADDRPVAAAVAAAAVVAADDVFGTQLTPLSAILPSKLPMPGSPLYSR